MKKTMLRILALAFAAMLLSMPAAMALTPSAGDLVKYIPTKVKISVNKVVVEGYFVNLNEDLTVKNFKNFEMNVYRDGKLIISGDFGTLTSFSIPPISLKKWTFTFNGTHNVANGNFIADDSYYCSFGMKFTTVSN